MKNRWQVIILLILVFCSSCEKGRALFPTPTPMPGWESYTRDTLLDTSYFPAGWILQIDAPPRASTDSMVNHVYRSWIDSTGGSGDAYQTVWRSYTVLESEKWFDDLKKQTFSFSKKAQKEILVDFSTPKEIDMSAMIADEHYLACGWYGSAYCELIARYSNYVMDFRIEIEMDYEDRHSDGLSYSQIQEIFSQADLAFGKYLDEINMKNQ
jgi:hypothetical protein